MAEADPSPSTVNPGRVEPALVLRDGLASGLLGGLVVAAVHLVADVIAGEPLRTPAALGALFADGPAAAGLAEASLEVALRFTGFHIAAWLVLGSVGSWLISIVDAHPRLASYVFGGFAFVFISVLYGSGALSLPGLPRLHLWVGTLLGATAAAGYLVWRHPRLARHIQREHLTEMTRKELERALEHEGSDLAAYRVVAQRFPSPIFAKMIEEKHARFARLKTRCEALGLPASEDPETAHAWAATTLEESLREAIVFERRTIDFYDRFLANVPEIEIRNVFLRLRYHVLDTTIPELQRAIETVG